MSTLSNGVHLGVWTMEGKGEKGKRGKKVCREGSNEETKEWMRKDGNGRMRREIRCSRRLCGYKWVGGEGRQGRGRWR